MIFTHWQFTDWLTVSLSKARAKVEQEKEEKGLQPDWLMGLLLLYGFRAKQFYLPLNWAHRRDGRCCFCFEFFPFIIWLTFRASRNKMPSAARIGRWCTERRLGLQLMRAYIIASDITRGDDPLTWNLLPLHSSHDEWGSSNGRIMSIVTFPVASLHK